MKPCHLTIISKNKKSIDAFLIFFFNYIKSLNFYTIKKYFQKKRKKKILTLLKSPHVNKKAQEQFESRYFSKQLTLYSTKNFKYLVFLKKIKTNLFSDIKMVAKFAINRKKTQKLRVVVFNPDNFQVKTLLNVKSQSQKLQKLKNQNYIEMRVPSNQVSHRFLKILDVYGELLKCTCLGSSVGRAKD